MADLIGVDVGGTFTDLVAIDASTGRLKTHKVLTSYPDPSASVRASLVDAAVDIPAATTLFHGTTIGINTVIQRAGPPTAMLTTIGFRDILELRRGSRSETWDLKWRPLPPLIPRTLRFEIDERVDASGCIEKAPDARELSRIVERCKALQVKTIAVCLLNSYVNPENEQLVRKLIGEMAPDIYVSISSDLSREMGEYERTSTAAVNAMLRPVMEEYLKLLEDFLAERGFAGTAYVMQSTGGVTTFAEGRRHPALVVESGPAAGAAATAEVAKACNIANSIAFDMGGTTAKACVVLEGLPQLTPSYRIGGGKGYVVQVAGVDIVEVGTGGGSIARVDAAGALRVGPQSAGSTPGPACYGLGGTEPTITDANLLLGRLGAAGLASGTVRLDAHAAEAAMRPLALALKCPVIEVAAGIIEIANVMMAGAVRHVTVERGLDPRDFTLVAYGGAGPLHACDIARQLHIPTVLVPPYPGHFSALGMLLTKVRRDYARTVLATLHAGNFADRLNGVFDDMRSQATSEFGQIGGDLQFIYSADMRYVGQHHTVTVRLPSVISEDEVMKAFQEAFTRQFAHEYREGEVEVVTARLTAAVEGSGMETQSLAAAATPASKLRARTRSVYFNEEGFVHCQVLSRQKLSRGDVLRGPALIEEEASTTLLREGDELIVNDLGCLVVSVRD